MSKSKGEWDRDKILEEERWHLDLIRILSCSRDKDFKHGGKLEGHNQVFISEKEFEDWWLELRDRWKAIRVFEVRDEAHVQEFLQVAEKR